VKRPALRWRKDEARKGLAAIGAPPRGWFIPDGSGDDIVSVNPNVKSHTVLGWYYVITSASGIAYFNSFSANQFFADAELAKTAAVTHLKAGWAALEKK
jgi:hypothetical protein